MTLFLWLIVLLLVTIMLFVAAAWREKNFSIDSRDQLNTDYYQQQATALASQVDSYGQQQPAMLLELEQRLLNDIPESEQKKARSASLWSLLPGVLLLLIMPTLLYWQVNGAGQWLRWQAITATYPQLRARLLNPTETNLTASELTQFAIGLRQDLALNPKDGDNWGMYARLMMALNQPETSRLAFERALQRQPDNQALKLEYATLLVRSPIQQDNQQATAYLKKLLAEYPKESNIINLIAVNFYSLKNYQQAIYFWQKLRAGYPQDSVESNEIQRAIAKARSESGQLVKNLRLDISLSEAVSKQLSGDEKLYISVADPNSRQVIALKQLPLGHFPLQVMLDDSDSTQEDRLLSTMNRIQVTAMIVEANAAVAQQAKWSASSKVSEFTDQLRIKLEIVPH